MVILIWQIIRNPFAERIWLYIRFAKWACKRLTEDADFGKKKIVFSDEAHFVLGGYVNKPNCRTRGTENLRVYIEKPMHPKRVTVWCGFWSRGIIEPFLFENEQEEAVTVNGNRCRAMLNEFLFTKIEEEDIGNIWFHFGLWLRTTQPKLHSMFCALFLMIALLAAELMSFGHLEAAIWLLFVECRQRKVLPRQARDPWRFKGQYSWSHWCNTAAHNR